MERDIFTNLGRLLITLGESGGRMRFSDARKRLGTQVYTSTMKAIKLGLANLKGDYIELTEKGKKIASMLVKCYEIIKKSS